MCDSAEVRVSYRWVRNAKKKKKNSNHPRRYFIIQLLHIETIMIHYAAAYLHVRGAYGFTGVLFGRKLLFAVGSQRRLRYPSVRYVISLITILHIGRYDSRVHLVGYTITHTQHTHTYSLTHYTCTPSIVIVYITCVAVRLILFRYECNCNIIRNNTLARAFVYWCVIDNSNSGLAGRRAGRRGGEETECRRRPRRRSKYIIQ